MSVTELIHRAQDGDQSAIAVLLEETYQDLRKLAHARLASSGRVGTLDTTSLVNEWFLRFAKAKSARIEDRAHFMRYAATVMRSVIVDVARRRNAERRGGGAAHESLTLRMGSELVSGEQEILRVHEALEDLEKLDHRMSQIVEMRYFAGMTDAEIAETLRISERTIRRDWSKARLWLAETLTS